jgi:hypothetical protein
VDETQDGEDDDREVAEQSRHFEVARIDAGWGVWDRRDPPEPLAMYTPDAQGFESAYEHFTRLNRHERNSAIRVRLMGLSLWIALVSGLAWIVSTAVFQIRINAIGGGFSSQDAYEALQWTNVVSGIAYPVFLVSFGLYVMMWMKSRGEAG